MSAQIAIDFEAARLRREQGMTASLDHADRVECGWPDAAYSYLCQFAQSQDDPWTVECFRTWAAQQGLTDPPDARAFGGVTQRAIKRGVIVRVGYAPAASSNGAVRATYSKPHTLGAP